MQSLPEFGTGVLYAILLAAAYTFAISVASGRGRPRLLQAARLGAYGTVALVGLAVLVLAYAFVGHDFRVTYVAHYSDRGMSVPYLLAALWGGQDGSLLWWLFLTSLFMGGCVWWLERRYLELQPYVIATLMSIVVFFAVLMIFAVNPFATSSGGAPPEGQGLNFQLRNFYMIVHPPSLYAGFTCSAVPFAFAVAALVTGRLDDEWIVASRKWMLASFLFLSLGNVLGMLWAYEELGWGGPWAWDPVENSSFLPWLTASAYVHSIMIQERRGMLKVWNVVLICLTFWLTIYGTFLTRTGLIASIHAFAQSGPALVWVFGGFMATIVVVCAALIIVRLPKLQSEGAVESVLSREAAFLLNNWGFLSLMLFIGVATMWPYLSAKLLGKQSTLGPAFYNAWVPILALVVFAMMGVAPLLGWRKTSSELFRKSFRWPVVVTLVVAVLHLGFGRRLGFPAFVRADPIYPGALGVVLAAVAGKYPFVTIALAAFNIAVVVQEFVRGIVARQQHGEENILVAFTSLVAKSRRRYGGYIVHLGVAVMFIGFVGRGWSLDKEASMSPGESVQFEGYTIRYVGPRMEVDNEKRMVFADVDVERRGALVERLSPGQFVYKTMGGQQSSEVARHVTVRDDLYMVMGMLNPVTRVAGFKMHVNTLISFIWLGAAILMLGTVIAMWPDLQLEEASAWRYVRVAGSVATALVLGLLLAGGAGAAYAADRTLDRAGASAPALP